MMSDNTLYSAKVVLLIPFHDVDSARVAWHGNYPKYLEIARCKLLDKLHYGYEQMSESGFFWPVVDMHLRYIGPIRFQQEIEVTATLKEWENRLKIEYLISDVETGKRLTKGSTVQVAVRIDTGEMLLASPQVFLDKL